MKMDRWTDRYGKSKDKFSPVTGHEGLEEEYMYSCTRSLTLALDGVGGQRNAPAALLQGRPGTHCLGGWVGSRASLDGYGNIAPTGIQSLDQLACSKSLYQLCYSGPHRQI